MRLILYKQDQISLLEAELHAIDNSEERPIFLGARRRDQNEQRSAKLQQLDTALIEYDRLLDSGERNTRRKRPASDDVDTLKNWFQNEGFLSREETKYLNHMDGLDKGHDLLSLHEVNMHSLGRHIERLLVKIDSRFKMRPNTTLTTNQSFLVFSDDLLEIVARALVASFIVVLLLVPVVILNFVHKTALRFGIIFVAAATFVSTVTIVSKAKTVEVLVAGATYSAALTLRGSDMAVPFGFSVSDFVTLGKLIGKVAVELGENDEASPEYQSLLIELEALDRALRKLQTLKPAKHELFQLTSIRATALACQRPLQDFLDKVSKFESNLGTFIAANNKWRGLPRRMQFRVMFKEDVKKLRSTLTSHVITINLLLTTQAVASISLAEDDRHRLASGLESKVLENRGLLEDIDGDFEICLERQQEMKTQLKNQHSVPDELSRQADRNFQQLSEQNASIEEIQITTDRTQGQTNSILAKVTEVLFLAASGLMHLRHIDQQLHKTLQLCADFTEEMRTAMSKLLNLFINIQSTLLKIDHNLPARLYPPIVQFTTALGESLALPYQLCQQWTTFTGLLRLIFLDKPGQSRVEMGKFMIMYARGGRLLEKNSWQYAVRQDDHLSMSIVLDELLASAKKCPFPTCQSSTEGVEIENGGRICRACGRWSRLIRLNLDIVLVAPDNSSGLPTSSTAGAVDSNNYSSALQASEDIELYRQVHVQYVPEDRLQRVLLHNDIWPKIAALGENGRHYLDDSLSNLDQVKAYYAAQPEKYNMFLNILSDFKHHALDTRGLMERISKLHDGDTVLVERFNTPLPTGYRTVRDQSEGFSVERSNHAAIALRTTLMSSVTATGKIKLSYTTMPMVQQLSYETMSFLTKPPNILYFG
ncbi:MAG: hypothetical protein Q9171_001041 [Xanthocarpia ochracea]